MSSLTAWWGHPRCLGEYVSVCMCVCVYMCTSTFAATTASTATAKLKNHASGHSDWYRLFANNRSPAVCVCVCIACTTGITMMRISLRSGSVIFWKLHIVLAHHTEDWSHCKLSNSSSRGSQGAAHFSSEWHILRLETPNTGHPSVHPSLSLPLSLAPACQSQLGHELMVPIWPRERTRKRLRAGWGERRVGVGVGVWRVLPASSSCNLILLWLL